MAQHDSAAEPWASRGTVSSIRIGCIAVASAAPRQTGHVCFSEIHCPWPETAALGGYAPPARPCESAVHRQSHDLMGKALGEKQETMRKEKQC